ncbi:MAG TPA: LysR family transcriptional regulator [Candidatus Fimadaptatus faecigallinarum]|uniref:LysR family transcriptional regulator n=1 Tax=Candidatus Fimadaptatus faecigallinarum TaxID=2840814 RepID=A0A9D1S602_9FIRM|nr:LysR family transcriptional regulator [Candidatus Fimadaptatus faecigallinarum]
MLDYRIDTFLALCDCMNYRRAAEVLHISQPAVTQQIHSLECMYDCKLFTYKNHRLEKTEAANILERYARAAKLHERDLRLSLSDSRVRDLKIGATKTIGDYFLGDYICRYLSRQQTALTLIVDNTEHLLNLLEDNVLDFAVVEGFFDKDRFDSILLRREPFVGICQREHPFAGREIGVDELMQQTIIHREAGSGTRAILEQELTGYNESLQRFQRHICISSFKLILDLVKRGYGISFVYDILAGSDPELAKFTLRGESVVREFNIVYLKYADLREKIRLFFDDEVDV